MGEQSQWQRLARLIAEARERAGAAARNHDDAAAQLDVAEYDLRQIVRTLDEVMRLIDGEPLSAAPESGQASGARASAA